MAKGKCIADCQETETELNYFQSEHFQYEIDNSNKRSSSIGKAKAHLDMLK